MKVNKNYDDAYKASVMTPEEAKKKGVLPSKDILLVGELGGGGTGDVTKTYVDTKDAETLASAKQYVDDALPEAHVLLADNLYTQDGVTKRYTSLWTYSASGESIIDGEASLDYVFGHAVEPTHVLENIDVTHTEATRVTITVDSATFITQHSTDGTYVYSYDGTDWTLEGSTVTLADEGITLTGTAANGDRMTVIVSNGSVVSSNYYATDRLTLDVNEAALREALPESTTLVLTYIENWSTDPATYGITVTGTPLAGDTITINYTKQDLGIITIAKPTALVFTSSNSFDKETMVIPGYTMAADGTITEDATSSIAYVWMLRGQEHGWIAYTQDGVYLRNTGWAAEKPTADNITTLAINTSQSEKGKTHTPQALVSDKVQWATTNGDEGYMVIALDNEGIESLAVHPRWSGTGDDLYFDYATYRVEIPQTDINGTTLPVAEWGMVNIGTTYDVIDFNNKRYVQYFGRYDYSAEKVAELEQAETPFIYDSTSIFYLLDEPISYTLGDVNNKLIAADYGIEHWEGETGPVEAQYTFLANLKDKLRTDVLTISPQVLNDTQKQQIWQNLGLEDGESMEF